MAISYSRPDPSSPSEVAAASFGTSRRGFDPNEVREFLRIVAAEIARLQEREAFLERELHTAQRVAPSSVVLDDALVTRMLGEEATRVLQAARDGAAGIRARAEEGAAALLRDAAQEAQRLREQADLEALRVRQEAAVEAEAEREAAKQHGRDMVNEARDYRERMLVELNRRRDLARQQIEALGRGRERLLQAFERARQVSVDVVAELTPLADADDDLDLSIPTTGQLTTIPFAAPGAPSTPPRSYGGIEVGELDPAEHDDVDELVAADDLGRADAVGDEAFAFVAQVEVFDDAGAVQHFDLASTIERLADIDLAMDEAIEHAVAAEIAAAEARQSTDEWADEVQEGGELDADATLRLAVDPALVAEAETDDAEANHARADDAEDVPGSDGAATAEVEIVTEAGPVTAPVVVDDAEDELDDASPNQPTTEPSADASHPDPDATVLDIAPAATDEPDAPVDDEREPAPVVSLFGAAERAAPAAATPAESRTSVDELFARLRASRTDQVARRANEPEREVDAAPRAGAPTSVDAPASADTDTDTATDTDTGAEARSSRSGDSVFQATPDAPPVVAEDADSPFARRDEALTPIILAAARRLKRVLADEQNEVLTALRRKEPVRSLDALVPSTHEHAARYAGAVEGDLLDAALAGAASMDGSPESLRRDFVRAHVTASAHDLVASGLVVPLRERLARVVTAADGDNTELSALVRTLYREWKSQRIDEQLDEIVHTAFGRGALAAVPPGTPITWMVDPTGPPCPDGEDNALAGVIPAGEPFPTEHLSAPAHPGCRCMIALAAQS